MARGTGKGKVELKENADGVLGVIISRDQFREYEELKQKRDRSELSMRVRMIESLQRSNELAEKTVQLLDALKIINGLAPIIVNGTPDLFNVVYDLANRIIEEGKY